MLNALRDKTQGLIGAVLMVVLVVPFALWGVSSYFHGSSTTYVARGHHLRITRARYEESLARERSAVAAAYGKELNPAALSSMRFKKAVLEGLVNKTLLLHDAKKGGFHVSPVVLAEEIRQVPAFRVHGTFSQARYEQLLQAQGMTPARFEQQVRNLTLVNELKVGLLASAFVPRPAAERAVALLGQRRLVSYAIVSPKTYRQAMRVSPTAVAQFYATHKKAFRLPEQVRVDYVLLSPQTIMQHLKASTIPESALRRMYASHASLFERPQQRLAAHILIALPPHPSAAAVKAADAKLMAIRTRILHGASFAAMARKYSQDTSTASEGGRIGYVTRGDLSKAVGKALFVLPVGRVSMPVRGQSGMHLFKVLAIRPGVHESFAQARGRLVQMVLHKEASHRLYRLSQRLRNKAYEHPHSVTAAAKAVGLPVYHSGWFTRQGSDSGIGALSKVVKAVFAPKVLAGHRNTHAIPVGEDGLLVAHVIGRKASRTKPLATVRGQIVQMLRTEQARARAKAIAAHLVAAVAKGTPFSVAARRLGLVVHNPPAVGTKTGRMTPALRQAVFAAPVTAKADAQSVVLAHGEIGVFVVKAVHLGNAAAHPQLVAKTVALLDKAAGIDTYMAYLKTLRARAHIHLQLGQL